MDDPHELHGYPAWPVWAELMCAACGSPQAGRDPIAGYDLDARLIVQELPPRRPEPLG